MNYDVAKPPRVKTTGSRPFPVRICLLGFGSSPFLYESIKMVICTPKGERVAAGTLFTMSRYGEVHLNGSITENQGLTLFDPDGSLIETEI